MQTEYISKEEEEAFFPILCIEDGVVGNSSGIDTLRTKKNSSTQFLGEDVVNVTLTR